MCAYLTSNRSTPSLKPESSAMMRALLLLKVSLRVLMSLTGSVFPKSVDLVRMTNRLLYCVGSSGMYLRFESMTCSMPRVCSADPISLIP